MAYTGPERRSGLPSSYSGPERRNVVAVEHDEETVRRVADIHKTRAEGKVLDDQQQFFMRGNAKVFEEVTKKHGVAKLIDKQAPLTHVRIENVGPRRILLKTTNYRDEVLEVGRTADRFLRDVELTVSEIVPDPKASELVAFASATAG